MRMRVAFLYMKPLAAICLMILILTGMVACWSKTDYMDKVSGALLGQVELRRQQIVSPNDENLKQMKDMGMMLGDLKIQRIVIYLNGQLSAQQQKELAEPGVKIYPDTWIPPVGDHPNGFLLAEMPVDKLEALAAKGYVIKLDTAEVQGLPQCPIPKY